jgi:hypothetical protein
MFAATLAGLIVALGGSPTTGIVFGLIGATASSPIVARDMRARSTPYLS